MATMQGAPPAGGDQNLGPAVMAVVWTEISICTIAVGLRFWSRRIIRNIGWDDWLMLLSQVLFIAAGALATAQNAVGGYRHTYYLTEQEIVTALEINYMLRAVVIVVYIQSKAAVGGLILRLTHRQRMWQRYVVWVVIILTALLNALNTIFNFVQCSPVEANWNPSARKDATCWPIEAQLDFAYFQCVENIVADAILAVIPITFLAKLNMPTKKKIYASALMGLGLMATVCGAVKTSELGSIGGDPDFTYAEYGLTVWSMSEIFIIIFCGSIPTMVPLYDKYFRKGGSSKAGSSGYGRATSVRLGGLNSARGTFAGNRASHYDWRIRDDESQAEDLARHAGSMDAGSSTGISSNADITPNTGIMVTKDVTITTHAM